MSYTGEVKRAYQRKWIKARREEWIASQGGCCVKCGSVDRLEIDHIDPSKKVVNAGELWSRTASVSAIELAKCQVLCHECHLEKTFGQCGIKHGTTNGYKHYKCRCQDCRDANAIAVQRQRANAAMRRAVAA
jgi:hypothetical protein